ncbi:MAG TPA: GntR family transcriptional regulator [Actinomycetes bacterium]|nr:GntR family transcriptional regulator [Actinomycetes bacterium]
MIVDIDPASPVPPYEQIRTQVVALVESGGLTVGARLPTVRQLAIELGVAPGTVAKAYRELETAGVVITKGRHGTLVAEPAVQLEATERRRRLDAAAEAFVREAGALGVSLAEAQDAVRRLGLTRLRD